jgi:hypothetical protein
MNRDWFRSEDRNGNCRESDDESDNPAAHICASQNAVSAIPKARNFPDPKRRFGPIPRPTHPGICPDP